MSNKTPADNPVINITDANSAQETQMDEEKQTFVTKTKAFVKTHKKPTIAVVALMGLVGAAALAGKKVEPLPVYEGSLELEPATEMPDEIVVETTQDTETA